MSAWYVFGALGFYPVNPVSGIYAIGSPVVSKAVLHLDSKYFSGRKFTVIAKNNSANNIYIQSATFNGKPLNRPWIRRDEVIAGGTLKLNMGSKPNPNWGSAPEFRPPPTMPSNLNYQPLPSAADK